MKKGLILMVLTIGMLLCLVGCKGKDKILGGSRLGNIEDKNITIEEMYGNEKYGYPSPNGLDWVFYMKYAKQAIQANDNSETRKVPLVFKIENSEDLDELNKYIDKYNENPNKKSNISFFMTEEDRIIFLAIKYQL